MKLIFILCVLFNLSYANDFLNEVEIDDKDKINDVILKSGKKDSYRYYQGSLTKEFDVSPYSLMNAIIAFDKRCNNEYKEKRVLLNKDYKCLYLNKNIIENKIHTKLKDFTKEPNEINRFIISRRVYNREEFSQNDLVKVYENIIDNKKNILISMEMISKKESSKYIDPLVDTNSAFKKSLGRFEIVEIKPNKSQLTYTYSAKTDHWLINKSIAVGEVFENFSDSLNSLFKNLKKESLLQAQQGK